MKKLQIFLSAALVVGIVAGGVVSATATPDKPDRPIWVNAHGKPDYSKLADTAEIPYKCWSGKEIKVTGKSVKEKTTRHSEPGSVEYEAGVAKSNELAAIPGVVTKGGYNIDESNPAVVAVMKKYEKKETPGC